MSEICTVTLRAGTPKAMITFKDCLRSSLPSSCKSYIATYFRNRVQCFIGVLRSTAAENLSYRFQKTGSSPIEKWK